MAWFKKEVDPKQILKIGFWAGMAEAAYCFLIALLFLALGKVLFSGPGGVPEFMFFLIIFVFSATISGIIVFGYPIYFALQQKFKEALVTLGVTLATWVGVGFIVLLVALLIRG